MLRIPTVEQDESDRSAPWVVKVDGRVIFRTGSQEGANSVATSTKVIQQINAEAAF